MLWFPPANWSLAVLPCGMLRMRALKLTECSDLVAKWGYRYERQMAWKSWY